MFKKQTFDNNIFMKIFHWVYLLLAANLCFAIVNLPFCIVALTTAIDPRNIWLFALSLLPLGPALIVILAWTDKLKEEKDIDPVKSFFQLYKQFWKLGLLYGGIAWLVTVISVVDILFFMKMPNGKWILPFFVLLAILGLALMIHCDYFQVRNPELQAKDILKTSFYFSLRKWYVSLLNVVLLGLTLVTMVIKPQFGMTILPILFMGIIYLNSTNLVKNTTLAEKML